MALKRPTTKKSAGVPWSEIPSNSLPGVLVYADFGRHTCIEISREADKHGDMLVGFIPFSAEDGLKIEYLGLKEFDHRFKPLHDYPVERAAKLYLSYALNLGATRDALTHLGKFTQITEGDIRMATTKSTTAEAKKALAAEKKVKAPKAPKSEEKAPVVPKIKIEPKKAEKVKAEKVKAEKPAKVKSEKPAKEGRRSAAQAFKDLIMAGKLTDTEIFKQVQAEFGLDDSKSGYVSWYRNNMRKTGVANVPDAKKG